LETAALPIELHPYEDPASPRHAGPAGVVPGHAGGGVNCPRTASVRDRVTGQPTSVQMSILAGAAVGVFDTMTA
jgi:hypothetical protein